MEETNGRYSDSLSFLSSNSQWIAFASKRDDWYMGVPRVYVSQDGSVSVASSSTRKLEVYLNTFKSYNIPELYNDGAETYDAHEIAKSLFR